MKHVTILPLPRLAEEQGLETSSVDGLFADQGNAGELGECGKKIDGAVIDVTDPEPLPADSPMWDVPNLVITPHMSSDDTDRYIPNTLDVLFENLRRLLAGEPLLNQIDAARGY
ncbi:MAG: hypothetical protein IH892_10875 [Planctomycetes bacterium]|nr:hypothetical protein [Planctomycetota bacterium]